MHRFSFRLGSLALGLCLVGCAKAPPAPATAYVDASDATTASQGAGVESQDIKTISDKMSRSLLSWGGWSRVEGQPRIVVMQPENRTRFRIDSALVSNSIMDALVKQSEGRFIIIDRSVWDQVQKEREMKEEGAVDGPIAGGVAGSDYFLYSEMRGLSTSSGAVEGNYVQVNFRMVDASTTGVMWTEQHDWKKEGAWDKVYQ